MTEVREDRERGEDTEVERFQERERENGEGKSTKGREESDG